MNILFLARRYQPAIGGVETHLKQVVHELSKRHHLTIVTEQFNRELPRFERTKEATIHRMPFGMEASKWQVWGWLFQHIWLISHADIIHVHDVFFWILPFRLFFFWKKFYITFHGYEAPGPLTDKQIFWHQYAAMLTRKNICIGEFHQKWYGVKPNAVSFGGVEKIAVSSAQKNKVKKFVFVGRLADDTGIREYIHAFSLSAKKEKAQLEICGDGPLRDELEQFVCDRKLSVVFQGFVKNVQPFFQSADVMLVSQYLSILQALANGKPVIAYADTLIKKDYLHMTPFANWITIAESERELVTALQQTRPLSGAAQKWARQQTWPKVAELYEELWKDE
jgi:glycosyltransferase involved in cell wall biosynthesis